MKKNLLLLSNMLLLFAFDSFSMETSNSLLSGEKPNHDVIIRAENKIPNEIVDQLITTVLQQRMILSLSEGLTPIPHTNLEEENTTITIEQLSGRDTKLLKSKKNEIFFRCYLSQQNVALAQNIKDLIDAAPAPLKNNLELSLSQNNIKITKIFNVLLRQHQEAIELVGWGDEIRFYSEKEKINAGLAAQSNGSAVWLNYNKKHNRKS
jgi:hypothetical protein